MKTFLSRICPKLGRYFDVFAKQIGKIVHRGGSVRKDTNRLAHIPEIAVRSYFTLMLAVLMLCFCGVTAFAAEDMWVVANRIIVDVYTKIAGISTVLAGLMSAVAVIGAKMSNNQHKVDQAWD